ncbi:MAG: hypothetical protein FJX35_20010 [Alphaproteobacteria bacterium]|nr:hypothetical protein [Alphaproteobacteria bacterium]
MAEDTANATPAARRSRTNTIPRRRYTVWAAIYFVAFVALPILGVSLLLDLALAVIFRHFGLGCFGFWCWLA